MHWKTILVGLPMLRPVAAAIEARNYLNDHPTTDDYMIMVVWVDGQVVCSGSESMAYASDEKTFCLRNHDGKGAGCAPGYAYCTTDNGRKGKLEYFEDNVLKHTFKLESVGWRSWYTSDACLTVPGKDHDIEMKCDFWESCLSTSKQSTCRLCWQEAQCKRGEVIDPPQPFPYPKPFNAMVIGDSLSQGNEGDFTWRYRIWDWIKDNQEYTVDMVGPWHGTYPRLGPESAKPEPPKIPGEDDDDDASNRPNQGGKYAEGVSNSFPDRHFARWGQLVHTSKRLTRDFVKEYQPSHILVMIGFNDLGWFVGDANQVINDLDELVVEAQQGKDDVQILIANIPHRSKIGGRDDLIEMTDQVNRRLELAVPTWNRGFSRTVLVPVQEAYDCSPGGCPDGTDGLHPKPIGEYHIAKAFADVLRDDFDFSHGELVIPDSVPSRRAIVPSDFYVGSDQLGLKLLWTAVLGVIHYEVRVRLKGTEWGDPIMTPTNGFYRQWVVKDQEWEGQVRSVMADDTKSGWSETKSAVMSPSTLAGPKNLRTEPDSNDIKMSWDAVGGAVDRYGVVYYDQDGSDFTQNVGTRATSYTIKGVNPGHRYFLAVETWGPYGGGWPTIGFEVIAGRATPAMPGNFKVESLDETTIRLSWSASDNAAGYRVWLRNVKEGGNMEADPYGSTKETSREIYFLFPGVWNFEFCVSAYNGNLESPRTKIVKGEKP